MLLIQFKAGKKKIIAAALAAILLVAGVIAGVTGTARSGDTATPDSARAEQPARRFLEENGLQPKELTRQRQITVPSAFNNTYENYNRLQRQSGFDLAPYKGKAALMLVFTLNGADADRAVLLIKDGRVIGGHLTNGEYGSKDLPLLQHGTTG